MLRPVRRLSPDRFHHLLYALNLAALHSRREAAARRVVRVDMIDVPITKKAANRGIGLARLSQRRIGHHSVRVERAQRQYPPVERWRHLVMEAPSDGGLLANKDGVAGAVRIIAIVRNMIEEQDRGPFVNIIQAHPAREARRASAIIRTPPFAARSSSDRPTKWAKPAGSSPLIR